MDVDWEVEIGGGAPEIEAVWPGFVDLRTHPDRIGEISEATAFAPIADLLRVINGAGSPFWTSKCDFWQPEPLVCACYIDVLLRATSVFRDWREAESFCRACVARMSKTGLESVPESVAGNELDRPVPIFGADFDINLVVRAATAMDQEGFGFTAYMSAKGENVDRARLGLARAIDVFADALLAGLAPPGRGSTLK